MDKKVLFSVLDTVGLQHSGAIAVEEPGRKTTYHELIGNSNRMARCLIEEQITKGQEIGVFLNCSASYISTVLGINKAGGIFMALDTEYPIKRMEYILNHVKPRIVVTNENNLPSFLNILTELGIVNGDNAFVEKIIVVTENDTIYKQYVFNQSEFAFAGSMQFIDEPVKPIVSGDDSMYLVNTSGSTGNPKMIEGRHKSLSHFIHWEVGEFNLDSSTRGCVLARPSFDLNLREMFAPLLAGGTLCVPAPDVKAQPLKLLEWLGQMKINLFHPIPSIFRQLMREVKNNETLGESMQSLRNILFAGEALFGRDLTDWRSIGGNKAALANLYGPSETTLAKICNRIHEAEYQPNEIIPLGKPLPNTSILIIADGLLCSENVIGEIHIKTPFRSKGYYKEPQMTAEKFIQNPLHNDYEDIVYQTGDLAKYTEDGLIVFTGRQDSQVKIRGNRVELPEIEKAIMSYENVKQAIVVAIKNPEGDYILACYYTGDAYFEKEDLRNYLTAYLPEYMFPSFYIHLPEFPLNLNGKIDKRALPKPEELLYEQLKFEEPQTPLEQKLAIIWADVLNLKKIGINNFFYELGGHSLSVTKVLSRIYKDLGIEITLKEIFDNPTIKKLANLLSTKKVTAFKRIEKVPQQEYYDLSHAQKGIWFLDQQEERLLAYNINSTFTLYGKLNVAAFKKAVHELVVRHESLRTTFSLTGNGPMQKIHEEIDIPFVYRDVLTLPLDEYIETECNHYFNLEEGPLLRLVLTRVAEDEHMLLFGIHHIIADGWSVMVLINEVTWLYNKIKNGSAERLLPLTVQYKDYAAWLNSNLSGDKEKQLKDFWAQKLSGNLSLVQFPADLSPQDNLGFRGDILSFDLDAALTEQIRKLNQQHGTTEFISFLTFINILLNKFTGKSDLIVGSPVAGRDHFDLENQIGNYVNVLPVRTLIDADETVLSLLNKIRKTVFEVYEHQLYPIDLITDQLDLAEQKKNLALFDILVQSQTLVPVNDNKLSELQVKHRPLSNQTSKVDLTFDLSPAVLNKSIVTIEYSTDRFSPAAIENIKINLLHIIRLAIESPNTPLADINLLESVDEDKESASFMQAMLTV